MLVLLASACGAGATPTACRIKYVERRNDPQRYQICMERWELRKGRRSAPEPAPAQVIAQPVPVALPIVTAFVDGVQRVCRLNASGTYTCDPLSQPPQ